MQQSSRLKASTAWWAQLFFLVPSNLFAIFALVFGLVGSFHNEPGYENALCGFLFFAGPLALLGWSIALYNIQMTEEFVTVFSIFGRYRIAWNDVEKIAVSIRRIALIGPDKRLVFTIRPESTNKKQMVEFIRRMSEQRKIMIEENARFPRTQLNTRVKR
jgi:hypothetical protein